MNMFNFCHTHSAALLVATVTVIMSGAVPTIVSQLTTSVPAALVSVPSKDHGRESRDGNGNPGLTINAQCESTLIQHIFKLPQHSDDIDAITITNTTLSFNNLPGYFVHRFILQV